MDYEFHVGDYVETVGGYVGWISDMRSDDYIIITNNSNNACGYYIPQEIKYFKRIGKYDFTKKDDGKIKPLAEEYTKSFPFYKITTDVASLEWLSIDLGVVGKKINELVDAVNELKEKME